MERFKPRGNYDSGTDFTLETDGYSFTFNEADFGQRIEQAARDLDFIEGSLDEEEREILSSLTVFGDVELKASPLAEHLLENQDKIESAKNNKNMINWLKHLVFRGAWLDQALLEGQLEVSLDEETMDFIYVQEEYSAFERIYKKRRIKSATVPSWGEIAYQPED